MSPAKNSSEDSTYRYSAVEFHLLAIPTFEPETTVSPTSISFVLSIGLNTGKSFSNIILPAELEKSTLPGTSLLERSSCKLYST